jgi:hypothetical protein
MNPQNRQKPPAHAPGDGKTCLNFCGSGRQQKVCRTGNSPHCPDSSPPFGGYAGLMQSPRFGKRCGGPPVDSCQNNPPFGGFGGGDLGGPLSPTGSGCHDSQAGGSHAAP